MPEKIKAKIKGIFKRKNKDEQPVEVKEEAPSKPRRTINDIAAEAVDEAFKELYAPAEKQVEEEKPVKKAAAKKPAAKKSSAPKTAKKAEVKDVPKK